MGSFRPETPPSQEAALTVGSEEGSTPAPVVPSPPTRPLAPTAAPASSSDLHSGPSDPSSPPKSKLAAPRRPGLWRAACLPSSDLSSSTSFCRRHPPASLPRTHLRGTHGPGAPVSPACVLSGSKAVCPSDVSPQEGRLAVRQQAGRRGDLGARGMNKSAPTRALPLPATEGRTPGRRWLPSHCPARPLTPHAASALDEAGLTWARRDLRRVGGQGRISGPEGSGIFGRC